MASSHTRPDLSKGAKHLVESFTLDAIPDGLSLPALLEPLGLGSVPIIDVSGLRDPTRRAQTVKKIALASESWGFFIAVNHGFNPVLMDAMLQTVTSFFELPLEEKMSYCSHDLMRTVVYGSNLNIKGGAYARNWRDYLHHFGRPFSSFHLWPANPPQYRQVTKAYLDEVWKLAMQIGGAISEGLGLASGYVERTFGEGSQVLAVNYYPKCPQPDLTMGLSSHTDRGGITILMQNGIEGLQVRHDGKWVLVPDVPGSFLVNIGDCVEIISNGKYKSVEHRAVVNEKRTRITVAVGNGPGFNVTVKPASELVDEKGRDPKYEPILFREFRFRDYSIQLQGKGCE